MAANTTCARCRGRGRVPLGPIMVRCAWCGGAEPPLVKGGQGRTERNVMDSAVAVIGAAACLALLAIGWWIGSVIFGGAK